MGADGTSRRRVRLSAPDLHRLLRASVRLADKHPAPSSSPAHPTIGLDGKVVVLRIEHPGGGHSESVAYLVSVTDRSMLVLQGGYVHHGTRVEIQIFDVQGRPLNLEGVSVWCDHLEGTMHVCGIETTEAIPASRLVDPDQWRREVARFEADRPLTAVIANYCDLDIDRNVLKMRLADTKCRVISLATPNELYGSLRSGLIDVCVLDLDTDSEDAIDVLRCVREAHFDGHILLSSSDAEAAQMASLDPIGRTHFLRKPIDCDAMIGLLRELLKESQASILDAAEISSSIVNESVQGEIREFVREARRMADLIENQIKRGDYRGVANKLTLVMNAAKPHGFAAVWPALETAVSALHECNQEPQRCVLKIRRAINYIRRMKAPPERDGQAKAA